MTKKFVISLGLLFALASGVLYGIGLTNVHDRAAAEEMAPPASLKALVFEKPIKAAPSVSFTDLAGGRHMLADFKGRYVLLNLWATWCAPCVSELPALTRLKAQVPAMKVFAVDVWKKDKAADIDAFLKSHNAGALGTLTDGDVTLQRSFGAYGLPMTVLVDPKGNVIAKAEGPAEWATPESIAYFKRLAGS